MDAHAGSRPPEVVPLPGGVPVLSAELVAPRWRWRRPARTVSLTDRALVWGQEGHRAAIPWAAVTGVHEQGGRVEVSYAWPYSDEGDARLELDLDPMMAYLVAEDIRRRLAVRSLPAQRAGG